MECHGKLLFVEKVVSIHASLLNGARCLLRYTRVDIIQISVGIIYQTNYVNQLYFLCEIALSPKEEMIQF